MHFPRYLALVLVMSFKSTLAKPLGLSERQSPPVSVKNIDINFCTDYDSGGTCTNIATYAVPTFNTNNHVMSNYATQVNTGIINGTSSVTVTGDSGAWCVFGSQLLSTIPETICGGWSPNINTGDPTYNLGDNNDDGPLNNNVLCFFCATQG